MTSHPLTKWSVKCGAPPPPPGCVTNPHEASAFYDDRVTTSPNQCSYFDMTGRQPITGQGDEGSDAGYDVIKFHANVSSYWLK